MAGWTVTASGNADDPAAHESLFERLRDLLSDELFGTGSSSFTSAHKTDSNFHTAPAGESAGSEGQSAGTPPATGDGVPADTGGETPAG
jgi:hypothetical protein